MSGMKNLQVSVGVTLADGNVPQGQDTDLNQAGFEALNWVEIGNAGNVSDYGGDTTFNNYDEFTTTVTQKNKGTTDMGTLTVECREIVTNNGQIAMKAAGKVSFTNAVAIKIEYDDMPSGGSNNTIRYVRGLVGKPAFLGGSVNDFQRIRFSIALNQEEVEVVAS